MTRENSSFAVAYCVDTLDYLRRAIASLWSLSDTSSDLISAVFFLIPRNLEGTFRKILKNKSLPSNMQPISLTFQTEELPGLFVDKWASIATYGRLILPDLLPEGHKWLLYLDADTFPVRTLDTLLEDFDELENSDFSIAGVCFNPGPEHLERLNSIGVAPEHHLSAGVLLFDVREWRSGGHSSEALEIARAFGDRLKYWDQDVLNIQFGPRYLKVSPRINALPWNMPDNPQILHYAGPKKPSVRKLSFVEADLYFDYWSCTFGPLISRVLRAARGIDYQIFQPSASFLRHNKGALRRLKGRLRQIITG